MRSQNLNFIESTMIPLRKSFAGILKFVKNQYVKSISPEKIVLVGGAVGKTLTIFIGQKILSEKFSLSVMDEKLRSAMNSLVNTSSFNLSSKSDKVLIEENYLMDKINLEDIKFKTLIVIRMFDNTSKDGQYSSQILSNLDADGLLILNWDDLVARKIAEKTSAQVIYFGTDSKNCHVWASNIRFSNFRTIFELNYGVERVEITTNLIGNHQIYPLLAAATLAISLDVPLFKIKKSLEEMNLLDHYLQPISGQNGSVIIDDTTSTNPLSVIEALDSLNNIPARRRIVVLGEMKDLGDLSEYYHRQVARKIHQDKVDLVFTSSGECKFVEDELNKLGFISERILPNQQNHQIVSRLLKILTKGDIVLVKGSLQNKFDEIVSRISKAI